MKRILLVFMLMFMVGCATDCSKCPVIVKPKVLTPVIACPPPVSYTTLQEKSLLSTMNAKTEGELIAIITTNVKLMEQHLLLWQEYRKCVDETVESYKKIKETLEEKEK